MLDPKVEKLSFVALKNIAVEEQGEGGISSVVQADD